jgi:hypothetical protein
LPSGEVSVEVYQIQQDPFDPATLYVASYSPAGLYLTHDAAASWAPVPASGGYKFGVSADPSHQGRWGATDGNAAVQSLDGGSTWSAWPYAPGGLVWTAFAPSDPDTIYAGTRYDFWRSTTGGQ